MKALTVIVRRARKGERIKQRLSLQGNPAANDDWYKNPKTNEEVTFIDFARSEGRFDKHFDKKGNPSVTLLAAKQDRLEERTAPATVDEAPAASVDELERSTRAQLYQRAQAADIAGRSEMTKAQLIAALRAHGATGDTTTA